MALVSMLNYTIVLLMVYTHARSTALPHLDNINSQFTRTASSARLIRFVIVRRGRTGFVPVFERRFHRITAAQHERRRCYTDVVKPTVRLPYLVSLM